MSWVLQCTGLFQREKGECQWLAAVGEPSPLPACRRLSALLALFQRWPISDVRWCGVALHVWTGNRKTNGHGIVWLGQRWLWKKGNKHLDPQYSLWHVYTGYMHIDQWCINQSYPSEFGNCHQSDMNTIEVNIQLTQLTYFSVIIVTETRSKWKCLLLLSLVSSPGKVSHPSWFEFLSEHR